MITLGNIKISEIFSTEWDKIISKVWSISRPNAKSVCSPIDAISIDAQISDFPDIILDVYAPIYIREYFATSRSHIIWAQTSRVMNLDDWDVFLAQYDRVSFLSMFDMQSEMVSAKKTLHQDLYRLMIPLCYLTRFSLKLSFREIAKIIQDAQEISKMMQDQSVAIAFEEVSRQLKNILHSKLPENAIEHLMGFSGYGCPPTFVSSNSFFQGGFVGISAKIKIALRAQLIRHRNIIFRDNFFLSCRKTPQAKSNYPKKSIPSLSEQQNRGRTFLDIEAAGSLKAIYGSRSYLRQGKFSI